MSGATLSVGGITMTNAAAMTLAGSSILTITGNVAFGTNVTYNNTSRWQISGAITSNGKQVTFEIRSNGTITLVDALSTTGAIDSTSGSFNASNQNVTGQNFVSTGAVTRTITMGSGTWTMTGSGFAWEVTGTNLTVVANTSTIKYTNSTNSASTFAGGGNTYSNLWYARGASTGTNTLTGANTFADFKDDGTAAHQITFPAAATTTVTSFTVSGNSGAVILLRSSSAGNAATLSDTTGTNSRSFLNIRDSTATGGATWECLTSCVNTSNNTGWNFGAPPVTTVFPFVAHSP
jgi:hypothetical protein